MSRTRASLKEEINFNLGGEGRVPDPLLNEWLSSYLERIQRRHNFIQTLTSATITVFDDTPTVAAPTSYGLLAIRGDVGMLTSASFHRARKEWLYPRISGYPAFYWLQGSTLHFHPKPNHSQPDDWAVGTTYDDGDLVRDDLDLREYESQVDSNVGNQPSTDDGTNWTATGGGDLTVYYLEQKTLTAEEGTVGIDLLDDVLINLVTARGFIATKEPELALGYKLAAQEALAEAETWDKNRYRKLLTILDKGGSLTASYDPT